MRKRSVFAAGLGLRSPGIGLLHACGTLIAAAMILTAFVGRVVPGPATGVIGPVLASAVVLLGLSLGVWGLRRANRDYDAGTPAGPDNDHRVQCSASKRVRPRLGKIIDAPFEPELFGVWFADAPRAAGRLLTLIAGILGALAMATVNWVVFRDPMHAAWITLGLAGPSLGIAVLGFMFPVEWKFTPGALEIIRPGLFGMGWGAGSAVIDLSRARVFVDADDREAVIMSGAGPLHLRWDIAANRDEITRALLMAALSTSAAEPRENPTPTA